MDVKIEGHPAELEWLRREIERDMGLDAQLEAFTAHDAEELREPLIIALIVGLGGPSLVTAITDIIKRRYQHREEMARIAKDLRVAEMGNELEVAKLEITLIREDGTEQPILESELEKSLGEGV